jgi:hypothetical protein
MTYLQGETIMSEITRMSDVVRPPSQHKPETPEGVALELMEMIFFGELAKPSRTDILSTYAECLRAAKGDYPVAPGAESRHTVRPLNDELAESTA